MKQKKKITQSEYLITWKLINSLFEGWYENTGVEWKDQQDYLSKQMKKQFKLTNEQIDGIFDKFNNMFPENSKIHFLWETYQLPVLEVLTSKVLEESDKF